MRQARSGASIVAMPTVEPRTAEPMVLVVHANFAVASAMAQRLMESCVVALVPAARAAAGLRRHAGYDVVVLCPYLEAAQRAGLVRVCAELQPQPAVLELRDEPGALDPHVRAVSVPAWHRAPAEHVLASLSSTP
jgi:LDH2 family malate/lactate/ureidoglycolate dehydrogenase